MQRLSTNDRAIKLFQRTPSGRTCRALLGGVVAFGAALPLLVGAVATYGTGAAEGLERLQAPTTDFSKLEQGEDKPGGGATSGRLPGDTLPSGPLTTLRSDQSGEST